MILIPVKVQNNYKLTTVLLPAEVIWSGLRVTLSNDLSLKKSRVGFHHLEDSSA